MKDACKISAEALRAAGEAVRPGITTLEIDSIVRKYIEKQGATPSFLGYGGFPASVCISVNNVVIHGIPSKNTVLKEGDIVSVDVGAYYRGFHGDNAYTFPCGKISAEAQALLDATKESLFEGIKQACPGNRVGDIGSAVQEILGATVHDYSTRNTRLAGTIQVYREVITDMLGKINRRSVRRLHSGVCSQEGNSVFSEICTGYERIIDRCDSIARHILRISGEPEVPPSQEQYDMIKELFEDKFEELK